MAIAIGLGACGTPAEPVAHPKSATIIDAGVGADAAPAIDAAVARSIALANEGVELFAQKSYAEAEKRFVGAILTNPMNHNAWYALGETQSQQDRVGDAVDSYEKAFALAPNEPMYALRVGQAHVNLGRPPESARVPLERAIQLQPRLYRAHFLLGVVHQRSGRATEAARAFTAAIRANPRFVRVYIDLTQLYLRWQRLDHAFQVATAGAERALDPGEKSMLTYYVGFVHAKRNHHRKAVEAFSLALKSDRDNVDALLMRGLSHAALRNKTEARADLSSYLERGLGNTFDSDQASKALLTLGGR